MYRTKFSDLHIYNPKVSLRICVLKTLINYCSFLWGFSIFYYVYLLCVCMEVRGKFGEVSPTYVVPGVELDHQALQQAPLPRGLSPGTHLFVCLFVFKDGLLLFVQPKLTWNLGFSFLNLLNAGFISVSPPPRHLFNIFFV